MVRRRSEPTFFWSAFDDDPFERRRVAHDPGDHPDDATPPFDFAHDFGGPTDIHEAYRHVRAIDSSVRVLEDVVDDPAVLEDLDVYFKGVWLKHHG